MLLKAGSNSIVKASFHLSFIYVPPMVGHASGEAISINLLTLELL